MRPTAALLVVVALSIVPRVASAQVSVTSPAAGAASSYRTAVIKWNPIAGASSYHLEIDDDPNFGSPEVDVTVAGTSYALSGERLRLNGQQQSWAAYVRINGTRWNANTFTPSYFVRAEKAALAVTSQSLVFLAFHDADKRIQLTVSSDWSLSKRLSLEDTFDADDVNLAVDEFDVVHAFWLERRDGVTRRPYYTNSATGWDLVQIPGTFEGCSKGSSFAARGQFEIFLSCNTPNEITRWTITNGTQFAKTALPNSAHTDTASVARDGVGNVYVASSRDDVPENYTVLQGSGDGWIPHIAAAGRIPKVAVTREGELHALRWGWEEEPDATGRLPYLYSNSLRGFQTWTALPVRSTTYFIREIPSLVVDATRGRLHAAMRTAGGARICSAAHTGLASNTGTSWTCAPIGDEGVGEDGRIQGQTATALAPDGTLHVAWNDVHGLGYANSLGSFLATNFSPQVSFGAASSTPSAAIVPATVRDADGDDLEGQIRVGRAVTMVALIQPASSEQITGFYTLNNDINNATLYNNGNPSLELKPMGALSWTTRLRRDAIGPLPNFVEVRDTTNKQVVAVIEIHAWDDTGVTFSKTEIVEAVQLNYSGTLPTEMDISSVPAGDAAVMIDASDGLTSGFGVKRFTKTAGQTRLLLTQP